MSNNMSEWMLNFLLYKDFYKVGHYKQYPKDTKAVFSNFTPRKSLLETNYAVFFGLNYFLKHYLDFYITDYDTEQYIKMMRKAFQDDSLSEDAFKHIKALQDYTVENDRFPVEIYALPEGTKVPIGVPALVIFNTIPEFYWVPNMLETIMSATLWGPCTSATIASRYRSLLDQYAKDTSDIPEFVDYQAHDFSFRGMYGLEAAALSGAAHLQYFKGTDSIPGICLLKDYYDSNAMGYSVSATEHSVMCAGGKDGEFETFKRLITEIYPKGIVSIVSDTWDLWNVVDNYLPLLKETILARDGKVVIRPDSGYPEHIICGSSFNGAHGKMRSPGLIEKLWDIFGGTINSKGYKQLDPHIGAIYGDGITLERCKNICEGLRKLDFASTNIVFGIGSYTYQYNTRDTLGWAMKATAVKINDEWIPIYKDPKTDDGTKKSHYGILKVVKEGDKLVCQQNCSWEQFMQDDNELKRVY